MATDIATGIQLANEKTRADGSFTVEVKEGDAVALKIMTPMDLHRPDAPQPQSWTDPTIELPSVRAGTKSLFLILQKEK